MMSAAVIARPRKRPKQSLWLLIASLSLAGSPAWGAERLEERDADGDGVAEVKVFLDEQGKPVRTEVDRNQDGTADLVRWLKDGKSDRDRGDLNFDGKWDAWSFYRDGLKDLMIMDKNHDGRPDAWFYYGQAGLKLIGGRLDEDYDGKPDRLFGDVPEEETRQPW